MIETLPDDESDDESEIEFIEIKTPTNRTKSESTVKRRLLFDDLDQSKSKVDDSILPTNSMDTDGPESNKKTISNFVIPPEFKTKKWQPVVKLNRLKRDSLLKGVNLSKNSTKTSQRSKVVSSQRPKTVSSQKSKTVSLQKSVPASKRILRPSKQKAIANILKTITEESKPNDICEFVPKLKSKIDKKEVPKVARKLYSADDMHTDENVEQCETKSMKSSINWDVELTPARFKSPTHDKTTSQRSHIIENLQKINRNVVSFSYRTEFQKKSIKYDDLQEPMSSSSQPEATKSLHVSYYYLFFGYKYFLAIYQFKISDIIFRKLQIPLSQMFHLI